MRYGYLLVASFILLTLIAPSGCAKSEVEESVSTSVRLTRTMDDEIDWSPVLNPQAYNGTMFDVVEASVNQNRIRLLGFEPSIEYYT